MIENLSNLQLQQGSNMRNFRYLNRLIIACLAGLALAGNAYAQSSVLVIDQARVMRDSEVGKHVARQLEAIAKSIEGEFKTKGANLTADAKKLKSETSTLGEGGLKGRPDLQKRIIDLQKKRNTAAQESAQSLKGLEATTNKAVLQVQKKVDEIAKAIGRERRASIVIDKKFLFYAGDGVDITDTVISRLNSQMKTIPVTRIK